MKRYLFLFIIPCKLFFFTSCEKKISCTWVECDTVPFDVIPQEVRVNIKKYIQKNPKYRFKGKYEAFDIDKSDSLIVEVYKDVPFYSDYYINRNYRRYNIGSQYAPPFWFYKNYLYWPEEFMLDSISVKYSLYYKVKLD